MEPVFTKKNAPITIITASIAIDNKVDDIAFLIVFASFIRERISPVFLF